MGVGANEGDVVFVDIEEDTGHNGARIVGADCEPGIVDTFEHHFSGEYQFASIFGEIAARWILRGVDTHEVEVTVEESEVDLLGIIVDEEIEGLIVDLLGDFEESASLNGDGTLTLAVEHGEVGGENILGIRACDAEAIALNTEEEIFEDLDSIF